MTLNCPFLLPIQIMPQFIQRDPTANRADALNTARDLLNEAESFNDNESLYFFQSAGLFLMFQDDNELSMAGPEEMAALARQLEELSFQATMYAGIMNGLFIPVLDGDNNLCFKAVSSEEFNETGVSEEVQSQYKDRLKGVEDNK
jgi:Leu/Phe-tRNA-protein transferase